MVLDVLENKERYYSFHKNFKEAFNFLERSLTEKPEPGKYEIKGDELFAVVQQYETSDDSSWEAHRKYIDIQFMLSGSEIIEWANIDKASKDAEYVEENDFLDCGVVHDGTECKMEKGYYSILWPEDLHKPKCVWNEKCQVDKIVIKVAL